MKKKTNLQTVAGEPRIQRSGPAREKTQVTVRLNQQLMQEVYAQMKEGNVRLTDMIERGLQLAVGEAESLPRLTDSIRFVLANVTKEQARLVRGLAVAMIEEQLADFERSESDARIFELLAWFLDARNRAAHAHDALGLYARYGRTSADALKTG